MRLFFQILILSLIMIPFQNCSDIQLTLDGRKAPSPLPPDQPEELPVPQKTMSLMVKMNSASSSMAGCWLSVFDSSTDSAALRTLKLPLQNNCEAELNGNRSMKILKEDSNTLRMAFRFNFPAQNFSVVEVLDLNKATLQITPIMASGHLSGFNFGSHTGLLYHGDCDSDGEKDLLVQNNTGKYVCLSMPSGAQIWTLPNGPDFPANSNSINDLDGDGVMDIQRVSYYGTTPVLSFWSLASPQALASHSINEVTAGLNFYALNFDVNGDEWPDYTIQGNQKISFYSGKNKSFLFEVVNSAISPSIMVGNIVKGRFLNADDELLAIQEGDSVALVSLTGQIIKKVASSDLNLNDLVSKYGQFQPGIDTDQDGIDELVVRFNEKVSLVSFKNMQTKTHQHPMAETSNGFMWAFHFKSQQ